MSADVPLRPRRAQWRAALAVLDAVCREGRVADASLQHWFREHREMGGRDRAIVTQLVYGVLRDAMRLFQIAGMAPGPSAVPETLLALHALDAGLLDVAALLDLGCTTAAAVADRLQAFDAQKLTDAARANVPEPIWAAWCAQYGPSEAQALAAALNREASVDLRVNTLKASPVQVAAALQAAGIDAQPGHLTPTALRLSRRVALQAQACYRDGWVEPQDEGSQLLAHAVAARPGERIADFCAGAGGKTLAMAAGMAGQGELWALDNDAARLARLLPRAARAGVQNLQLCSLPDADWLRRHAGHFDAVLVDAPCSGTGTWRRSPDLRLRPLDVAALARQQLQILAEAASLLRPGGRLIYATCSLLAAENERVITEFLSQDSAFIMDSNDTLALAGDHFEAGILRLLPHRDGTDGFFAARMIRRDAA